MSETAPTSVDDALFRAVQAEDERAWGEMVERFAPLVLAAVRRSGCRPDEAEDVVQSTWQKLFDHAPRIGAPSSLPAWILRTARREAWAVVRRRRHGADVEERAGAGRATEVELATDELLDQLERAQAVRDGIDSLGGRCTALLRALFLTPEEPDYTKVARALGMPVGSIGPTRSRCLAKLAARLADESAT